MTSSALQPALPGLAPPRPRRKARTEPAERDPVAAVQIDAPVPHLDRVFDYEVPNQLDDDARPGVRVKVPLAGKQVSGFIVARQPASQHGSLRPIARVVSPLPVLTPATHRLAEAVARHYAGGTSDVLRLAIPPRHAAVEKSWLDARSGETEVPLPAPGELDAARIAEGGWSSYRGGEAFLRRLAAAESPWAVWGALPWLEAGALVGSRPLAPAWPTLLAGSVLATLRSGRRAVVVLPTLREVRRFELALAACGIGQRGAVSGLARLVAEDGPAARYRSYLAALTGKVGVVIGTRAAAYAPLDNVGLVALWDEGNDQYAESRAPYPHTRTVAALRAEQEGAALLLAGLGRSVQAQQLVETRRAGDIRAEREFVRALTPRLAAPGAADLAKFGALGAARIPPPAWRLIETALRAGPVLIQVPRRGYAPVIACGACGQLAACPHCGSSLELAGAGRAPRCPGCGHEGGPEGFTCAECGSHKVRAVRVGATRLAEELGRAFPGTRVRLSGAGAAEGVIDEVDASPALVIATQGAEPVAETGYAGAIIVDGHLATNRAELGASIDALRRWLAAAGLARPAAQGGQAMLLGTPAQAPAGAFVRWDPAGFASRELVERGHLGLAPTRRIVKLRGTRDDVKQFVGALSLAPEIARYGPTELPAAARPTAIADDDEPQVDMTLAIPLGLAPAAIDAITAAVRLRSARRKGGVVRVQVDPPAET